MTLAKVKFNTLNARPLTLRQVKAREELSCNNRGTTIRYPESIEALVPWAKCPLPYPMAQVCTFYWLKVYESYLLKVPHLTGTLNEPARLGSMSQQNLKAEASKI